MRLQRVVLTIVFIIPAMFVAFGIGAWIFSTFFAPSQGFAGGAEVFVSGALTGIAGGVLAGFVAARTTLRGLILVTSVTLIAALILTFTFYLLA